MTVRMKPAALWTTLPVYLLILGGNIVALIALVPLIAGDIRTGPGPVDLVNVLVAGLALFLVGVMVINLVRFARLRIRADDQRVWIPRSFGIREVRRGDLTAIRAGRLSSRFAKGVRVFRFLREDGTEAFHVQAAIFPEADLESLATYLHVPIDTNFP